MAYEGNVVRRKMAASRSWFDRKNKGADVKKISLLLRLNGVLRYIANYRHITSIFVGVHRVGNSPEERLKKVKRPSRL